MKKDSPCPQEPEASEQGQVPHLRSAKGSGAQNRERDEFGVQGVPEQEGGRIANQGQGEHIQSGPEDLEGDSWEFEGVVTTRQALQSEVPKPEEENMRELGEKVMAGPSRALEGYSG